MVGESKGADSSQQHGALPGPLPPVRIEVPVPGPWSDLISGLKALGFDVSLASEREADDLVVLVAVCAAAARARALASLTERTVRMHASIESGLEQS